jgi:hypothetical protein
MGRGFCPQELVASQTSATVVLHPELAVPLEKKALRSPYLACETQTSKT